MQGEYRPEYKLAEDWGPLLEDAAAGKLHATLQQHHEQLRTANGSFRGTLAPDLGPGGGYNVVILVHFPTVRNGTAARLTGSGAVPGFAPAEAAAADWAAEAEWRYGGAVRLRPESRTVLAVSAEPHLLQVRSLPESFLSMLTCRALGYSSCFVARVQCWRILRCSLCSALSAPVPL